MPMRSAEMVRTGLVAGRPQGSGMFTSIVPERWRGPIIYVLMSLFVAWHAICLIVGPAPQGSAIAQALRPLIDPYLNLLSLNVKWGFFAPIGSTDEFRYIVVDSTGKAHTFRPTAGLAWYHPGKLWTIDRYRTIAQRPGAYSDRLIGEYCRKHAGLKPVEIKLLQVTQEKDFLPSHYLAGKDPLGPEFATTETLGTKKCPKL
jgi:hypothetical protein